MSIQKSVILMILALGLCSCAKKQELAKPNVIIILADDQGWGDLSAKITEAHNTAPGRNGAGQDPQGRILCERL